MEPPRLRPGRLDRDERAVPPSGGRLLAYFSNSALANAAIQWLIGAGVPADSLAVTDPDHMPRRRGMLLCVDCPDQTIRRRAEAIFRTYGAQVREANGQGDPPATRISGDADTRVQDESRTSADPAPVADPDPRRT